MKNLLLLFFCPLLFSSVNAQVGIGNTDPDPSSMLDVTATDKGILIPRVSLNNVSNTQIDGINTAATGLLIYNTNAATVGGSGVGFYFFNTAGFWEPISGNSNTLDQAYDEGGPGAGRIINATSGAVEINNGRLEITATADANGTTNSGVLEIGNSLRLDGNEIITNTDSRLFINNDNNGDVSMDGNTYFLDASASRIGIGKTPTLARLDVQTTAPGEDGLWVQTSGGTNIAATIVNTNGSALTTSSSAGFNGISSGSGGIFTNLSFFGSLTGGESGVEGGSQKTGVEGRASNTNLTTIDKMGGLFYVSNSLPQPNFTVNALAAVGSVIDGTAYKIFGLGIVSTIVEDAQENKYIMVAPEAPEALFQDYGIGQLINGKAIIKLDPILAQNIAVDSKHPLKVFIQLEGDCNGVYVTNKTDKGFEVRELNNGTSNTSFSYQIIANRADETHGTHTSHYSDMRFKSFNQEKLETVIKE